MINPFTLKIISINRRGLPISFGSWIQPPWPKIAKIPQNLELSAMKDGPNFCKKRGPNRHLFLFNADTWEKTEGFYCIWACFGQKPPSVSPNSPPAGRNSSCKIGTVTEKPKIRKKRLKDSFDSPCSWNL
jgi:hypothetical protein